MIELVVVVVILGILAAVAIPRYVDMQATAKENACKANRDAIRAACAIYKSSLAMAGETAVYPSTYNTGSLYDGDTVPTCPSSGTYTYSSTTGRVTCSEHAD